MKRTMCTLFLLLSRYLFGLTSKKVLSGWCCWMKPGQAAAWLMIWDWAKPSRLFVSWQARSKETQAPNILSFVHRHSFIIGNRSWKNLHRPLEWLSIMATSESRSYCSRTISMSSLQPTAHYGQMPKLCFRSLTVLPLSMKATISKTLPHK